MKRRFFLALLVMPTLAFAHSAKLGNIDIGHSWALPSAGPETEVMMPLLNAGATPDALISAHAAIANAVELRKGGAVVPEFILSPQKPFPMRAVANHLHVLGLSKPLVVGDTFPLTLTFKNAGEIEIQIHIAEKPGE